MNYPWRYLTILKRAPVIYWEVIKLVTKISFGTQFISIKNIQNIILEKLARKIETVYISPEMIESYFPDISDKLKNKMLDAILKAWDEQLSFCETCPTRCISEKDEYCTMFDEESLYG